MTTKLHHASATCAMASAVFRSGHVRLRAHTHADEGMPPAPASSPPPPASSLRRAITLVELLITMVIIAIVAAAILGTASSALDAARRSRTQSIILKLHTLLMERWGDYESRRIDINPLRLEELDALITQKLQSGMTPGEAAKLRGLIMADLRLLARRELMKIEMPDRWSDVLLADVGQSAGMPVMLADRTALAQLYARQYVRFGTTPDADTVRSNQGAECLCMIIMFGTGDGEAREQFTDQDMGDTDNDGAPEFLDGWGRPIGFVRWPAGLNSPVQPVELDDNGDPYRDALINHDPFDAFRRDSPQALPKDSSSYGGTIWNYVKHLKDPARSANAGFALVPLIYSMGADEDADVVVSPESIGPLTPSPPFDPYGLYPLQSGDEAQLGATIDLEDNGKGWQDNITNHQLEY